MKFKSIIVFLNRKCPVECPSCSAGAQARNQTQLTTAHISTLFEHLNHTKPAGYIIWTGGEPFLSLQTLLYGVKTASESGYHSEILTSGIWFENTSKTLDALSHFGNVSIRISLDAEHQQKVPISRIIDLIRSAIQVNIPINFTIRDIPGQPGSVFHSLQEIKQALPEFYRANFQRSRWLHQIPHIPLERFQNNEISCFSQSKNSDKKIRSHSFRKPCKMVLRDLVIGEDGYVYPCCGFFSLSDHLKKHLTLGNIMDLPSLEILSPHAIFEKNALMCILREKGPYGIMTECQIEFEEFHTLKFENICHLCLALFNQKAEHILPTF